MPAPHSVGMDERGEGGSPPPPPMTKFGLPILANFSPLLTLEKKVFWTPPHTSLHSALSADQFDGPHDIF